jgi:hypothetical protein
MRATVQRCDVETHMHLIRVFGGAGTQETQSAKGQRHQRQLELFKSWPQLHQALMATIGLDRTGAPLERPTRPPQKE